MELHSAVRWNKIDEVSAILSKGQDVSCSPPRQPDTMNSRYDSPTSTNRPVAFHPLTPHRDRPNQPQDDFAKATANKKDGKNGNTALHIAAQNGHLDLCKLLVSKGADVNAQNAGGNTPLHMVTSYDIDDVKAYLEEQGANGGVKNQEGFQAKFGLNGEKDPTSLAVSSIRSGPRGKRSRCSTRSGRA